MKPTIGIFGLSGCWGEQIVILNCEDQLLELATLVDIADFLAASSAPAGDSPLTVALVEGSVASDRDEKRLRQIRERSKLLVACGSCACFGGVAAGRGPLTHADKLALVYGSPAPAYDARPHRPLSDFVAVDFTLPGCPMEKDEFLSALACLLNGDKPEKPAYPVCAECRMAERECLLAAGAPCLGPVTAAGCHARCPGYNVACIGCRGPFDDANLEGMRLVLRRAGLGDEEISRRFENFGAPLAAAGTEEMSR
jgi:coenzyme F420-reducing hydrogenase gamma subunit